MFCTNIVLSQPVGFTDSQFHCPLCARGQPRFILDHVAGCRQFFDGPQYVFRRKPQLSQYLTCHPFFIENETEQNVFGSYIVMTQALCCLLGILQHPFCIICKSVIHILSHPYTLVRADFPYCHSAIVHILNGIILQKLTDYLSPLQVLLFIIQFLTGLPLQICRPRCRQQGMIRLWPFLNDTKIYPHAEIA